MTDQPRLDTIALMGLTASGNHGVLDSERAIGQAFVADVVLHVDARRAALSDDLADTVDYDELATRVVGVLTGPRVRLLETLATRIAEVALAHEVVQAVDVTVHKPQAPLSVDFADVVVSVHRARTAPEARVEPVGVEPVRVEPVREDRGPVSGPVSVTPPPFAPPPAEPPAPDYPPEVDFAQAATMTWSAAGAPPGPVPLPAAPAEDSVPMADPFDEAPAHPVDVVLALGGNLGDVRATLRSAVTELDRTPGLELTAVSPLARTAAVGNLEQPDFYNAVVLARTTLSPRALLAACSRIEDAHGRTREEHWGPRTLDIDIITYDSLVGAADDLSLPHPRAAERGFVLVPWAQIAPEAILPGLGGGPVGRLAETAPDRDGVRWLALDWLVPPGDGGPGHPA